MTSAEANAGLIDFSMQENCILCSVFPDSNLIGLFSGFHRLREKSHIFAGVSMFSRRNCEGVSVLLGHSLWTKTTELEPEPPVTWEYESLPPGRHQKQQPTCVAKESHGWLLHSTH